MKLLLLAGSILFSITGELFGQIGETMRQCTIKYGPILEKEPQEWHKFKGSPHYLVIHFYQDRADAVQYLNWIGRPKAFKENEIRSLLTRASAGRWEITDDGVESTMYVTKGFTAIHLKLDHILIVATDGYLERGAAAKAEREAAKLKRL